MSWLTVLNRDVVSCTCCPRLVAYREQIARDKRRAYFDWEYWGKPVPGFGDPDACVVIMGSRRVLTARGMVGTSMIRESQ